MFKTKIDVRYGETDKMGIVYHSRYFDWFEVARSEYLKSFNMTYSEVENAGVLMPVVDCFCRFKSSAVYGDTVTVETEATYLGVAKCRFDYKVYNGENRLLAEGYTVSGFVGIDFKPLNLKKKFPQIYEIFEKMRGDIQ